MSYLGDHLRPGSRGSRRSNRRGLQVFAGPQSGKSAVLRAALAAYVPSYVGIPAYYASQGHVATLRLSCTPSTASSLAQHLERRVVRHRASWAPPRGQQLLVVLDDLHLATERSEASPSRATHAIWTFERREK